MSDTMKALPLPIPDAIGVFFDTETNGLPVWGTPSGGDDQPHLVQLAAVAVNLQTREIVNSIDLIVKPQGWEIPQECVDLNGITTEYATAMGLPEVQVLEIFLSMWNSYKRFAYNTTFDNRIIRIGTKRYFNEQDQEIWKAGEYECQMIASRKHLGGKNPKLAHAYKEICGKELINAHTAMADALACMEIYFALQDINAEPGDVFK